MRTVRTTPIRGPTGSVPHRLSGSLAHCHCLTASLSDSVAHCHCLTGALDDSLIGSLALSMSQCLTRSLFVPLDHWLSQWLIVNVSLVLSMSQCLTQCLIPSSHCMALASVSQVGGQVGGKDSTSGAEIAYSQVPQQSP